MTPAACGPLRESTRRRVNFMFAVGSILARRRVVVCAASKTLDPPTLAARSGGRQRRQRGRPERCLPVAAREIEDVARLAETRDGAAHLSQDRLPLGDR